MAIDGINTPWTSQKDYLYSDAGFLRVITGITNTSGTLSVSSSLVKMDFTGIVSAKVTYVGAATDVKYIESKTSTGVVLRIPNNAFTVDAKTGYKTSTNNSSEKLEATIYTGYTNYKKLLDDYRAGNVVCGIRGVGLKAGDDSMQAYEHICGKITDFQADAKEGMWEIKLTITGGTAYTAGTGFTLAAYKTAATGTANKIQPDGVAVEYTIKDIVDADFNGILGGTIVETAAV